MTDIRTPEILIVEAVDTVPPLVATNVEMQMDPRLQRLIATRDQGMHVEATASAGVDEVSVIAKVSSVDAWEALSEVRMGTVIPSGNAGDKTAIVTGRIPVARIEAVRRASCVISLKAAQPLQPTLAAGVTETKARPDLLPAGTLSNGGKDVVIGIVDYGCDFAHRNFIGTGGKTRLLSIWHQGGATSPTSPFGYGREYSAAEVDAALSQPDPYAALGYGPAPDTINSQGTHGTHVMDIAAGNGNGSGVPGFSPQADLVFVDVSHADLPWEGPDVVGSSFGDSTQLLEAISYIFDKAGDRPCVINISLGTNGGPHDGSTLVEQGIDSRLAAKPNRALTLAASNSFEDGIHASAVIAQGGDSVLTWRVGPGNRSQKELELWYGGADRFDVELIAPNGSSLGVVTPGNSATSVRPDGTVAIFLANRLADPNNDDNTIGIFLDRRVTPGDWKVRLHGSAVTQGLFHAWIERDNVGQSSFLPPYDNSHTVGSISCGQLSIVVGSYDAHKPAQPISWFSSAGPTRDNRQKPELSAPGHAVMAAHSRTGTAVVSKSGTSMAAPATAGIVALVLGEARAQGKNLSIAQLRTILTSTARRGPPAGAAWDDRYGAGRIDAAEAVKAVSAIPGGVPPAVAKKAPAKPPKPPKKKKK
jgi:hypothetical protein